MTYHQQNGGCQWQGLGVKESGKNGQMTQTLAMSKIWGYKVQHGGYR